MNELQDLIAELHAIDQRLVDYENRYGVLSETFYTWYQIGTEPTNPDWVQDFALWAGTYQLKLRRQDKYRRVIGEVAARRDAPSFVRDLYLASAR